MVLKRTVVVYCVGSDLWGFFGRGSAGVARRVVVTLRAVLVDFTGTVFLVSGWCPASLL